MVKNCAVQGCRSGRLNEEYKRVAQGLRRTTLFQIPKSQTKRQLWMNALKQELKDKDRICEHHFLESDIIKGKSYLIDGQSLFIENERWHLYNDAIPFNVDENNHEKLIDCSQEPVDSSLDQQVYEGQLVSQPQLSQSEPENKESSGKLKEPPDLPDNQFKLLNQQKCEQQLIQQKNLCIKSEDLHSTNAKLEQPSELQLSHTELVNAQGNEQQLILKQKGLFIKSEELEITDVKVEQRPLSQIECDENDVSLEQIKLNFSLTLPERWCYHFQSPDLILIHLDATSFVEKFRLRVTENLAVMISVRWQQESILISRLKSLEELYRYMSLAETFTFCCGTSLEENRYSSHCSGIITKDKDCQVQSYPRCAPCRTLRGRLLVKQRYQRKTTRAISPRGSRQNQKVVPKSM